MNNAICYAHYGCDPYYNMAVDEFLFQQALNKPSAIYLRLYTWKIGTITFGFNQNVEKAVDHDKLGSTPLIRRVTGGRALYHDPSEITYAIIVNTENLNNEKLTGSLNQTSQSISEALMSFLDELKINSHYVRHSNDSKLGPKFFHSAPCFESASKYEIKSDGKKIIASAQRRIGNSLLQHGAIKINGVADHPALNLDTSDLKSSELKILSSSYFNVLHDIFFKKLADYFNLSINIMRFTESEDEIIRKYSVNLQEKSLIKRIIVKQ